MTPVTTPSGHFTKHNDGTVTHKTTGLMWKVCSEGQTWTAGICTGVITTHTWQAALQAPATINSSSPLSGGVTTLYTDWRLPNLNELESIVELQCYNPAINESIFPNTASEGYWSSSAHLLAPFFPDGAWGVVFRRGGDFNTNRSASYRVRLVRGGQ